MLLSVSLVHPGAGDSSRQERLYVLPTYPRRMVGYPPPALLSLPVSLLALPSGSPLSARFINF